MSAPTDRFDLDEAFDEAWYIRNYADIGAAVLSGKHKSGWQHYSEHGRAEGRQPYDPRLVGLIEQANEQIQGRLFVADEFVATPHGALLLGWIDDRSDPLVRLVLQPYFGPEQDLLPRLARFRRDDIAIMLNVPRDAHDYGFWVALDGLAPALPPVGARLEIGFASGSATELHIDMRRVGEAELRDRLFALALLLRNAPPAPDLVGRLAGPLARALTRTLLARSTTAPPTRFGRAGAAPALSVIVPLMADAASCLLQAPFLAATDSLERAEFIYVHGGAGTAADFEPAIQAIHDLYGFEATALRCLGAPGPIRARNAGAAAARGATLLFLAPDALPAAGLARPCALPWGGGGDRRRLPAR